jgi:hypothetical protein
MAETQDRVTILHRSLKTATRDAFLFQTVLAGLSEEELLVLEQVCEKYKDKVKQVTPVLVGQYYRADLDKSFTRKIRRLFKRKSK